MTGLSVVIPVFRDDQELEGLMQALIDLSVEEVIVVDGEIRSRPKLAALNSFDKVKWINAPRGRGAQIAAGIKIATNSHIWVLHADCRPRPGSLLAISKALLDPTISLTCFPLSFRTRGASLSLFALMSRIDSPFTTFGDQGFAFRKSDYQRLGLRLANFPLLEDVALRAAFKRIGNIKKSSIDLPTSARRFERLGIWKTQIRNIRILLKYWSGTSPKTLHSEYYKPTRQTALSSLPSWPARQVSRPALAEAQRTENDYLVAAHLFPPALL